MPTSVTIPPCDDCCGPAMPITVYKCGGYSYSIINRRTVVVCVGCNYVYMGTITSNSGSESYVNITCAVGNIYNSREGVAIDANGVVVSYRNAVSANLAINYSDCWNHIFDNSNGWCGY